MNIRRLNLNLLFVFTTIFEEKSISRASDKLAISQPALSASLKQLRDFFHDEIFIRSPQGMMPTTLAKKRYPQIRDLLHDLEQIITADEHFCPERVNRTFTLAMPDFRSALLLPKIMEKIKPYQPNIKINIKYVNYFEEPQYFLDKHINLGIGFVKKPSNLWHYEHLREDKVVIIGNKKNPFMKKKTLTLEDYLQAQHISFIQNAFDERNRGDAPLKKKEFQLKNTLIQTNSIFNLYYFLKNNTNYISTFSHTFTSFYQKEFNLGMRDLPYEAEPVSLGFLSHKKHEDDVGLIWLKDLIRPIMI